MFKAANPYDDIVNKATDENLTSENWEFIMVWVSAALLNRRLGFGGMKRKG